MNWRSLLKNGLVPSKLKVSRTFEAGHKKEVKITADYDHITGTSSFNVRISDKHEFSMLTGLKDDTVECKVFGTRTLVCNLSPKLPACKGCPLAD